MNAQIDTFYCTLLLPNLTKYVPVVLSCYVQTYGRTDRQRETRKLEDAAQERQDPLEGLTNTDERSAVHGTNLSLSRRICDD